MESFITIVENYKAEITEKKSRFIANIFYINTQQEAEKIIKETKTKYYDARHNCIAYRVIENNNIVEKSSDDGEPSGTAGAPMLNILQKNNLCNVLVIVTRYFGGILLGTGGLVRAYSDATIKVVEKSVKVCKCKGTEMQIELEYSELEKFKYYCKNNNININNIQYLDVIICNIETEVVAMEKLLKDVDIKSININKIKVLESKYINKSI